MSRSGYSDDCENLQLYRANVDRTIAGKRGQAFLREMAAALDAMPVRQLIAGEVVRDSDHVCAIGSVALARKVDVSKLDIYDGESVGQAFGITRLLANEIAFVNDDDFGYGHEVPSARWVRVRRWVDAQLTATPSASAPTPDGSGDGS